MSRINSIGSRINRQLTVASRHVNATSNRPSMAGSTPSMLACIHTELPPRNGLAAFNAAPNIRRQFLPSKMLGQVTAQAAFSSLTGQEEAEKRIEKIKAKSTPYLSKKSIAAELNGEVFVASYPGGPDKAVTCRHLAYLYTSLLQRKIDPQIFFSSAEGISTAFDGRLNEIDAAFQSAVRLAPEHSKHLLSSDQFGDYLSSLATGLSATRNPGKKKTSQAICLVLTCNHVMAFAIEKKSKSNVSYLAATMYDPNDTASYKRVVAFQPEGFKHLSLEDMLASPENIFDYAGSGALPMPVAVVCLDPNVHPPMPRNQKLSSANLYMALRSGLLEEVRWMLQAAEHQAVPAEKSQQAIFELLQASGLTHKIPGLYFALQYGYSDTVSLYTKSVLALQSFPDTQKAALLAAESETGVSGLYMALQNGLTETVKALIEPVLHSGLSDELKIQVLAAKRGDGLSGLSMALCNEEIDTVKAYIKPILDSNLPEPVKVLLLKATNDDGASALEVATENGAVQSVLVFTESIRASEYLSQAAKNDLTKVNLS